MAVYHFFSETTESAANITNHQTLAQFICYHFSWVLQLLTLNPGIAANINSVARQALQEANIVISDY